MPLRADPNAWHLQSRLKLRQLHLLLALDELRSLHRAAERVHLTQPAATRLLGQVERAIGLKLFERSARGMMPTAAGAALIQGAREVLGALARAGEELGAIGAGSAGRVHVGVLVAAAPVLLPRAIARFKASFPEVTVAVQEGTLPLLLPMLREGELDLVVGRLSSEVTASGMALESLHPEPMRVVVRAGHPLRRRRRPTLRSLAEQAWILPGRGTPYRLRLDAAFRKAGAEPPRRQVESASMLVNASLLQETDFLGVMPQDVAEQLVRLGALAVLEVELPEPTGPIGLITRPGQAMTPATREFAAALSYCAAIRLAR
jgi:DNA-binding transcriptional LysR family regulator